MYLTDRQKSGGSKAEISEARSRGGNLESTLQSRKLRLSPFAPVQRLFLRVLHSLRASLASEERRSIVVNTREFSQRQGTLRALYVPERPVEKPQHCCSGQPIWSPIGGPSVRNCSAEEPQSTRRLQPEGRSRLARCQSENHPRGDQAQRPSRGPVWSSDRHTEGGAG